MAIQSRKVKNKRDASGVPTGKSGTVYDVNIKYNAPEGKKSYAKRGFLTKQAAVKHESEMRTKLSKSQYSPVQSSKGKILVMDYMANWLETYGNANLRPSTYDSYNGIIKNHINPNIGHVQMRNVTPEMLDDIFKKMYENGLSQNSARNTQRVLSVSFEGARKYRMIEHNPAREVLTKFGKQGKTPDPYTVAQMQQLMGYVSGTEWEVLVMLAGMYAMRLSEAYVKQKLENNEIFFHNEWAVQT